MTEATGVVSTKVREGRTAERPLGQMLGQYLGVRYTMATDLASEQSHTTAESEASKNGHDPQLAVGSRVPALNSRALVAGRGIYIGDITLPGMLHMAFVRSIYAHALVKSIDISAAQALAGVVCVVTGDEIRRNTKPIPQPYNKAGIGSTCLRLVCARADDKVRYVGEALAVVVAEDKYTAHKAAELVEVDYEELPVVSRRRARNGSWSAADRALMGHQPGDGAGTGDRRRCGHLCRGRRRDKRMSFDAALLGLADGAARLRCQLRYFRDQLTVWASTQCPHPLRTYLAHVSASTKTAFM